MTRQRWLVTLMAAASLLCAGCTRQLRSSTGDTPGLPVDVNDAGGVLAIRYVGGIAHAVLLTHDRGELTDIPGPDGAAFQPYALNDQNVVVGATVTGTGLQQVRHAVTWTRAGGFTTIPLPAGVFRSWATDVNNQGFVVLNAYSPSASPADGAYLWRAGMARAVRLPEPPGAGNRRSSVAEAINEAGDIVGATGNGSAAERERAVVWAAGGHTPTVLGAVGTMSHALDVNERGAIAGSVGGSSDRDPLHAAAWINTDHVLVDLGPGVANAINDLDVAVGQDASSTPPQAATWSPLTRLKVRLGELTDRTGSNASAVNDLGTIVGDAAGDAVTYTAP